MLLSCCDKQLERRFMCSNCTISYADKFGKKPKRSEMGYCFQCKHPTATDDANSNTEPSPSTRNDAAIGKWISQRPCQLTELILLKLGKNALPPLLTM